MVRKSYKSLAFPLAAGLILCVALAGMLGAQAKPPANKLLTGEAVFRARCASCHGLKGEGTQIHHQPLTGTRSVGELTQYIGQSMPPGPRKCQGEDAKKVAAYIYDAFYSPLAQARIRPPRVALSRLTVRQFRNTVTDLVGSFRPTTSLDARRGLHGTYFKAREFRNEDLALDRLDPEVHFDFGTGTPGGDKFNPHLYTIRWEGGVLAPDTGEYDFIVRTEHGARLWVNDERYPLIDAWVKSGKDTEYRGSIFLLGGRIYPLRLEFTKSTQGVDDTDKLKNRPVAPASIALAWQRPKQAAEVIPQRCLFPEAFPETFVAATPFPPDDRSTGYERGTSVSKDWDEATTNAALETADYVTTHLRELSGVPEDAADRPVRLQAFCRQWVERAFRQPLAPEATQLYVTRPFQEVRDPEAAVKRVVVLSLLSPRFLYQQMDAGPTDAYAVAARLSFGLWDSQPDAELLSAAAKGELSTREQVMHQAERMVADPRAWSKLREFFLQWLRVDQVPALVKDARRYPDFDAAVASDLRTSLELSLENVAWGERADYRELMLTDKLYLNGRLAKLYGVNLPPDAPFQPVALDTGERAGILTHPYLLASFAYLDTSSPIHRGVLIMRNVLGRTLKPPPAAFAPLPADLHPNLTTRQRVALQTKPEFCNACHGKINPLGYTLERFDAIGRLRDHENGQPIDATGSYQPGTGPLVKFSGATDLARYVAGSDEAHAAFVEKLFHALVKQPAQAYGPKALPDLEHAFAGHAYNIRELMVEIMAETALTRYNNASPPSPAPAAVKHAHANAHSKGKSS